MKKTILALAAMLMAVCANAQILDIDGMPPYKLGVTAGLNVPTFSASDCSYTLGYQAGLDLMIDASDIFDGTYLRVMPKYSMKGATRANVIEMPALRAADDNITLEIHSHDLYYTTHYVDIPVHYGYGWALNYDFSLLLETGPYVAFGLGGTIRESGENWTESCGFFSTTNASRIDYGWGFQAGLLFDQQLMLNVSYDWGFKNMTTNLLQNNWFSVGLTYYIDY